MKVPQVDGKNSAHTVRALVATYLELMEVPYQAVGGQIRLSSGEELDLGDVAGLLSYDFEVARAALTKVLAPTGKPVPELPRSKQEYTSSHDAVVWREHQLLRSPNPPSWVFAACREVTDAVANTFYFKNQSRCKALGLDAGDCRSYAQIWLILFWSRYRHIEADRDSNSRLLRTYLRQRFTELHNQMVPVERLDWICGLCKTESMEPGDCCDQPMVANRHAGKPGRGGLRYQDQLTAPPPDQTFTVRVGGREEEDRPSEPETIVAVPAPDPVRLSHLRWPQVRALLAERFNPRNRRHGSPEHRQILEELVSQEQSQELRVGAGVELERLNARG